MDVARLEPLVSCSRRGKGECAIDDNARGTTVEDTNVTNHSLGPVRFIFQIALRSDFADLFEVKSRNVVQRGCIVPTGANRLASSRRRTRMETSQPAVRTNGRISAGHNREDLVGAKGFEPSTPRSRTECSTRLSHAPTT
jgi:hypothetical protein